MGHDFTEIEAVLLSETLAEGVALLAEIVTRPVFPPDQTERIRAESLDALIARQDEPANVADDRALLEAFGAHPYGTQPFGTAEGIRGVPREALAAFHAAHYRPAGALVVAAGEFDPAELREALERGFAGWTGAAEPVAYPPVPTRPANAGRLVAHPWDDAEQSEIRIIGPGMARRDPDWIRAGVANFLLGGSTITADWGEPARGRDGRTACAQPSPRVHRRMLSRRRGRRRTATRCEKIGARELADGRSVAVAELRRAREALMLSLRASRDPTAWRPPSALEATTAREWGTATPPPSSRHHGDVQRMARRNFDHDGRAGRGGSGGGIAAVGVGYRTPPTLSRSGRPRRRRRSGLLGDGLERGTGRAATRITPSSRTSAPARFEHGAPGAAA